VALSFGSPKVAAFDEERIVLRIGGGDREGLGDDWRFVFAKVTTPG